MRKLVRTGGLKGSETRRRLRELKKRVKSPDPVSAAMLKAKRPSFSGGWHVNDLRCPQCRQYNSIKRRLCAKCGHSPANGRLTKAALKVRTEEHCVQATIRKHGLYPYAAAEYNDFTIPLVSVVTFKQGASRGIRRRPGLDVGGLLCLATYRSIFVNCVGTCGFNNFKCWMAFVDDAGETPRNETALCFNQYDHRAAAHACQVVSLRRYTLFQDVQQLIRRRFY